jgi:hypothetical protein
MRIAIKVNGIWQKRIVTNCTRFAAKTDDTPENIETFAIIAAHRIEILHASRSQIHHLQHLHSPPLALVTTVTKVRQRILDVHNPNCEAYRETPMRA